MNSKEMSNKVKLEGEIIGDNKRISEALKEISYNIGHHREEITEHYRRPSDD